MSTSYASDYARIQRLEIEWNKTRITAASMLAVGYSKTAVAEEIGVHRNTIYEWLDDPEFAAEVDRLSLMTGIASRAERMRLVNRLVRQKIREDGTIITEKDILDWLKFAQSETTGAKIDLSKLAEMLTADDDTSNSVTQPQLPPAIEVDAVESGDSESVVAPLDSSE